MRARSLLLAFVRIGLAVGLLGGLALFLMQERLIFPGQKLPAEYKFAFDIPFEEKILEVDGLHLDSLLFHAERPRGLILYFHGNAGNLAGWGLAAEEIAKRTGFDVWIFDYPGYGKSEGSISSEAGLHRIAEAFFAEAEKLAAGKLVLYGRSIGSGLAAKLASEHRAAGLVLETPYLSLAQVVQERMSFVPLFLLKYSLNLNGWLDKVACPVLIVHGDADEVIPFQHGERLAREHRGAVFVPIAGGHHNDLSSHEGYWPALTDFLKFD